MKDLHTHIEQNNITTLCTKNWHDLGEHTQALKCDLIAEGLGLVGGHVNIQFVN